MAEITVDSGVVRIAGCAFRTGKLDSVHSAAYALQNMVYTLPLKCGNIGFYGSLGMG